MTKSQAIFVKFLRVRLECTWSKLFCHWYNRYELQIPFSNDEFKYSQLSGRDLCRRSQEILHENWQDES